MVGINIGE